MSKSANEMVELKIENNSMGTIEENIQLMNSKMEGIRRKSSLSGDLKEVIEVCEKEEEEEKESEVWQDAVDHDEKEVELVNCIYPSNSQLNVKRGNLSIPHHKYIFIYSVPSASSLEWKEKKIQRNFTVLKHPKIISE